MARSIAGLCVAKNEADIIEAMVRHNLGYLDRLHVVDHDSADATPRILAALAAEYPGRLTWESDVTRGHVQTAILNARLRPLLAETGAAQVVLLDADEFIRAEPQHFRDSLMASEVPILLPWVTYVPTAADDPTERNPVTRIVHRRERERPQTFKSTVPAGIGRRTTIAAGNHAVHAFRGGPAVQVDGLSLAHFPVRSCEQLTSKVLIGVWNIRVRGQRGRGEAFQWYKLYDRIMAGDALTNADLEEVAVHYAARRGTALLADPLLGAGGFSLKYTPDGASNLIRNLVAFTEGCVRLIEQPSVDTGAAG
ncbi:MAG: glycosyltransferase family 2 protein [Rhodobacterales bacterium]|nr:glycosyltransferase family 2 protein [Rhodobacterales bacterium]